VARTQEHALDACCAEADNRALRPPNELPAVGRCATQETVMPAAEDVAALAVKALLDELSTMRDHQLHRIAALEDEWRDRVAAARADAIALLADAKRHEVLEAAAERLAAVSARRGIPQPARAAAYAALVAVVASDLLPPATFRTLYEAWETGLEGLANSSAVLHGEEVLLHIG
jgi:hypothetical protein